MCLSTSLGTDKTEWKSSFFTFDPMSAIHIPGQPRPEWIPIVHTTARTSAQNVILSVLPVPTEWTAFAAGAYNAGAAPT